MALYQWVLRATRIGLACCILVGSLPPIGVEASRIEANESSSPNPVGAAPLFVEVEGGGTRDEAYDSSADVVLASSQRYLGQESRASHSNAGASRYAHPALPSERLGVPPPPDEEISSPLHIRLTPDRGAIGWGETVSFKVSIINQGGTPLTSLFFG